MIHKEGRGTIGLTLIFTGALMLATYYYLPQAKWFAILLCAFLIVMVLQFFRNPVRIVPSIDSNVVLSPCDGKVVVIEETEETEYFKERRIQVSIFMSPLNVHINWNPLEGKVLYYKYHAGKYLVAWHPKSSTENERTTTVYQHEKAQVLVRQIAGALARRIVNYLQPGDLVARGGEMGFIKFGSRVDLFFPLGTEILVSKDQKVTGIKTPIAKLV